MRKLAREALFGVGDSALGEWEEIGGRAFHVRRRLTDAESLLTGPMVDIRGTSEVEERLAEIRPLLASVGYEEE